VLAKNPSHKNTEIFKFSLGQGLAETSVWKRAFWIVNNFSILKYAKEKRHLNVRRR
jgi:hypothetical protein